MLHCSTLQHKSKEDWKTWIVTKEDYDRAVASGIGWVLFEDLPLSWEEAKEIIEKEKNNGRYTFD